MQRYLNPNKLKLISKGVDSVRSRVLNLNEKYPQLTRDIIYDSIEKEFLRYHGVNPEEKSLYEKLLIEDEGKIDNPKINELFEYYNSWDWKFGECPEFTNSLAHKFDWGLVDLCLRVEKGIIQESTIFSDCLNTEFIEKVNMILKNLEGKFSYDKEGISDLFHSLTQGESEFEVNPEFKKFIEDIKRELVKYV
jgi:lipoate-protein ligase A